MAKKRHNTKRPVSEPQIHDLPVTTPQETPPTTAPENSKSKPMPLAVALWLLVLVAFAPVLRNDFINYDDPAYVVENYHVQSALTWDSLRWAFCTSVAANWHPLTWLSHMLDFQIFGLRSWGHHLTSLLIHSLNTCLVFVILRSLTGALWRSWIVAALFGLHPMHVESVAWVAERKDVLCAFFWLLTLWAYGRYARQHETDGGTSFRSPAAKFYFLSILFSIFALMSKPMAVTLPFVLLLLDYWPLNRLQKNHLWPPILDKLPFFALAAILCWVTLAVQKAGLTVASLSDLTLAGRLQNVFVSYVGYIGKLLVPVNLSVYYPLHVHLSLTTVLITGALLAGATVYSLVVGRRQPFILFGWAWFIGTLVPVIGLVQVGSQAMADRYSYLPSIGLFVIFAWGTCALANRWHLQTVSLVCVATAVLALCTALTWRQVGYWRNSETLFRHALAVNPYNVTPSWCLADYEIKHGRADDAIHVDQDALKFQPDFPPINDQLGLALCKTGRPEEGILRMQFSLVMDPTLTQGHSDLADVLAAEGKIDEAVAEYRKTILLYQDFLSAYNRLGVLLERSKRYTETVELFKQAVQVFPSYAGAHVNLGQALAYNGQVDEAMSEYQKALRLNHALPLAHVCLGILLENKDQIDEAVTQFNVSLRLDPNSAQVHNELGTILGRKGQLDDAIRQFQEAVRLDPGFSKAQTNLNLALEMKRKQPEKLNIPAKP